MADSEDNVSYMLESTSRAPQREQSKSLSHSLIGYDMLIRCTVRRRYRYGNSIKTVYGPDTVISIIFPQPPNIQIWQHWTAESLQRATTSHGPAVNAQHSKLQFCLILSSAVG